MSSNSSEIDSFLTSEAVSKLPPRERMGVAIEAGDTQDALSQVQEMESSGVKQAWTTIGGSGRVDTLSFYIAAALKTNKIRLGTSIVPIYPRHPLVMASQALAINDLAPNRFRLGIGPSHRHIIQQAYGIPMKSPLSYLREYFEVLHEILWSGNVDYHGRFFNIVSSSPRKAEIPILVSSLGKKAFHLAGEISDGTISWLCPVPYLLKVAKPALKEGAESRNRRAPPLVAHVLVAMSEQEREAIEATQKRLATYTRSPFYTRMFAEAGFPIGQDGSGTEALAKELLVMGSENQIKERLVKILESGLDELLIFLIPVADDESEQRRRLFRLVGSL